MWGPGSSRARARRQRPGRGFTLIELMVVVALVALTAGLVSLAVRDPQARQLEQEAARLAALLESARAEARASALPVQWVPQRRESAADEGPDFRFVGLPARLAMPSRWLGPDVWAEVVGARAIQLGPEPIIGAQRLVLRLGDQRVVLATDGLAPFSWTSE
jgi:general secretion pathway protein H